jgi:hypothetical protein
MGDLAEMSGLAITRQLLTCGFGVNKSKGVFPSHSNGKPAHNPKQMQGERPNQAEANHCTHCNHYLNSKKT